MRLSRPLPSLLAAAVALACLLAGTSAAPASAAVPGVNIAGAPTPDRVDEALATGAKYVRIFALWSDFEPNGPRDFPSPSGELERVWSGALDRINAAGARPIVVLLGTPAWANAGAGVFTPPLEAAAYAAFAGEFAHRFAGRIGALEIWNEPDAREFWATGPSAAAYATLLRAAYAAAKAGDPSLTVLAGPTTGNNYGFLDELYAAGAGDSFDGVAVHTDTACLDRGPDAFYRDAGRLARFTFLGYREVAATLAAHGQAGKPIWMTELGWSSTGGRANSCTRGDSAGRKPDGVSEAAQAGYLSQAYACLANDPSVVVAAWFTMRDATALAVDELNHYGLLRADGSRKPAYDAFAAAARSGGGAAGPCGDFSPPRIKVISPAPGEQFVDKLDVRATATDAGVGLGRITFNYDGGREIRNFTDRLANGSPVGLAPWNNSGKLGLGDHTIEVVALDRNGNTSVTRVPVRKVRRLAATRTPRFRLRGPVRCRGRSCALRGALSRGKGGPSISGKVAVEWRWRNGKGQYRKLAGGLKPAGKPFVFRARLRKAGRWRARVTYRSVAPYKRAVSRWVSFRVR